MRRLQLQMHLLCIIRGLPCQIAWSADWPNMPINPDGGTPYCSCKAHQYCLLERERMVLLMIYLSLSVYAEKSLLFPFCFLTCSFMLFNTEFELNSDDASIFADVQLENICFAVSRAGAGTSEELSISRYLWAIYAAALISVWLSH